MAIIIKEISRGVYSIILLLLLLDVIFKNSVSSLYSIVSIAVIGFVAVLVFLGTKFLTKSS